MDEREHASSQDLVTGIRLETKVGDIDQLAPEHGRHRAPGTGRRHAQVPSSGFLPTSPGLNRQDIQFLNPASRRIISGAEQALVNPDKDRVKVSGVAREDYTPAFVNPSQQLRPLAPEEPESPERDHWPTKHHPFQQRAFNDQINLNANDIDVKHHNLGGPRQASGGPPPDDDNGDDPRGPRRDPEMLLQLETRPISHEQLVVEVKSIYAGLVMVEAKCIDIDERQSVAAQEKNPAKKSDWQPLIALHKQLLHEHYDFFLASQHPSASPALSRLATENSMPARMWRHGIHALLEVLRHRLPESLEHLLAFTNIAYTMIAVLYETVPTFENNWIECLGDLGRYRMAIEDKQSRDRELWSNIARFWYNKAVDKTPTIGRLYHHLTILAPLNKIEQLSLYTRALTCLTPFKSARETILTLFNPILQVKNLASRRSSSFETVFLGVHSMLFTSHPSDSPDRFNKAVEEIDIGGLYESYISKASSRFKEIGVHAAVSNIAALLEYGTSKQNSSKPRLLLAYENAHKVKGQQSKSAHSTSAEPPRLQADASTTSESETSPVFIIRASRLASVTLGISLTRANDGNRYPLVHVYLVFIWSLILVQQAWKKFEDDPVWRIIEKDMPWVTICSFLNTLAAEPFAMTAKVWAEDFPKPDKDAGRPLPEDFIMRGQLYSRWYFPHTWFTDAMIDADERTLDVPSTDQSRVERLLWLGLRIASAARWIHYDMGAKCFVATDYVNVNPTTDAKLQPQPVDHESVIADVESSEWVDDMDVESSEWVDDMDVESSEWVDNIDVESSERVDDMDVESSEWVDDMDVKSSR